MLTLFVFPSFQSASAMALVSPTLCATQTANAFVFPIMPAPSVTAVHLATTDILTAPVSWSDPSESHSSKIDKPGGCAVSLRTMSLLVPRASSHDSAEQTSLILPQPLVKSCC